MGREEDSGMFKYRESQMDKNEKIEALLTLFKNHFCIGGLHCHLPDLSLEICLLLMNRIQAGSKMEGGGVNIKLNVKQNTKI